MIRGMVLAVVLLSMGMTAGPSEAQYRVKAQQGSATSNAFGSQNRGAHFNPKELTIDKQVPWQKGQRYEGGMFFGRGTSSRYPEGGVTGFTRKVIGVTK